MIYQCIALDALPRGVVVSNAASAKDYFVFEAFLVGFVGGFSVDDCPYFASTDGASLGALVEGDCFRVVHNAIFWEGDYFKLNISFSVTFSPLRA